ncbi:MAG: hypothetical protein JW738_01715 [Actinobacteria bacterium]|nr:hypothetical protein [Actinomycetota bacterium]
MDRLKKKDVKNLTDKEVKTAYERIKKDHSFGLVSDRKTSAENARLLEAELRDRNSSEEK